MLCIFRKYAYKVSYYHIYPKYWDTLTPDHTCLSLNLKKKKKKESILLPVDLSKIVLDEWQTM